MSATTRPGPPHPGAPLRIGFAGTPEFAAIVLRALLTHDAAKVVVAYTQPDRPAGRGRKLQPSAVKLAALDRNVALRQPRSLRGESAQRELAACNLDVFVVAAYGLILPGSILATPRYGCINVHASLLPRWRGAAPIERAIMAGDATTGVSIMQMDAGLDTGPVLAQVSCPIEDDTLGPDLERTLADIGAQCLLECLATLQTLVPKPQSEAAATYAPKLSGADANIDWALPAQHIQRQIRALCGRLPATTEVDTLRVKLLAADWKTETTDALPGTVVSIGRRGIEIACGEGTLIVQRVQLNRGKGRPLSAADAINGYPDVFAIGTCLADPT